MIIAYFTHYFEMWKVFLDGDAYIMSFIVLESLFVEQADFLANVLKDRFGS